MKGLNFFRRLKFKEIQPVENTSYHAGIYRNKKKGKALIYGKRYIIEESVKSISRQTKDIPYASPIIVVQRNDNQFVAYDILYGNEIPLSMSKKEAEEKGEQIYATSYGDGEYLITREGLENYENKYHLFYKDGDNLYVTPTLCKKPSEINERGERLIQILNGKMCFVDTKGNRKSDFFAYHLEPDKNGDVVVVLNNKGQSASVIWDKEHKAVSPAFTKIVGYSGVEWIAKVGDENYNRQEYIFIDRNGKQLSPVFVDYELLKDLRKIVKLPVNRTYTGKLAPTVEGEAKANITRKPANYNNRYRLLVGEREVLAGRKMTCDPDTGIIYAELENGKNVVLGYNHDKLLEVDKDVSSLIMNIMTGKKMASSYINKLIERANSSESLDKTIANFEEIIADNYAENQGNEKLATLKQTLRKRVVGSLVKAGNFRVKKCNKQAEDANRRFNELVKVQENAVQDAVKAEEFSRNIKSLKTSLLQDKSDEGIEK